jgi:hypothetical protein
MAEGDVFCVECGWDTRTGERFAGPVGPASSPELNRGRIVRVGVKLWQDLATRKVILVAVAVVLAIGVSLLARGRRTSREEGEPVRPQRTSRAQGKRQQQEALMARAESLAKEGRCEEAWEHVDRCRTISDYNRRYAPDYRIAGILVEKCGPAPFVDEAVKEHSARRPPGPGWLVCGYTRARTLTFCGEYAGPFPSAGARLPSNAVLDELAGRIRPPVRHADTLVLQDWQGRITPSMTLKQEGNIPFHVVEIMFDPQSDLPERGVPTTWQLRQIQGDMAAAAMYISGPGPKGQYYGLRTVKVVFPTEIDGRPSAMRVGAETDWVSVESVPVLPTERELMIQCSATDLVP